MATRRLREFLDGNGARYVLIHHSAAFTANEVAESIHLPGRYMAKVVVAAMDGRLALAVVPATHDVDFIRLRLAAGARTARLADEAEFAGRFEGCQTGTVPPFGRLFGVETYVDRDLAHDDTIAFNAGTHTDVVVMGFNDYRRVAHPTPVSIAMPRAGAPVGSA